MPLRFQRVTLVAATVTPIVPPFSATSVTIGNATTDDLRVYMDPTDTGSNYLVIAAGFSQPLELTTRYFSFEAGTIAFYLNAIAGGTAVLTWR